MFQFKPRLYIFMRSLPHHRLGILQKSIQNTFKIPYQSFLKFYDGIGSFMNVRPEIQMLAKFDREVSFLDIRVHFWSIIRLVMM